ncbi:MAG: hypothetical protein LBU65_06640, partial [Planctomycetaceae bacterium]|nr:hypothetical protein [Planctomycetaceae bacterium]
SVSAAWQILRQDQERRSEWPTDLGPVFLQEIRTKKSGDEISDRCREIYREFIDRSLPAMIEEVRPRRVVYKDKDGKWLPLPTQGSGGSGGGLAGLNSGGSGSPTFGSGSSGSAIGGGMGDSSMPGGNEIETKIEGILDWPAPEINRIKGYWSNSTPSSGEIWYTQEDLWVYSALIAVVKRVNSTATGPHNAIIKRIENLWIGQQASSPLSERSKATLSSVLGSSGGMGDSMSSSSSSSSSDSMMSSSSSSDSMGGASVVATAADSEKSAIDKIKNLRYVGKEYEPLKATDPAPYVEFNRMPVCLRLIVDQNKIPELLVEFANCPMPMDILWVRFNPPMARSLDFGAHFKPSLGEGAITGTGSGDSGMGDGGMGSSSGSSSSGFGSSSGSSRSSSSGFGSSSSGSSSNSSDSGNDKYELGGSMSMYGPESIPIEIYGVINIFNSPQSTPELQIEKTGDEATAEPAAPAEPVE